MKCLLLTAKDYKLGFEENLTFTGFEDGRIQWLGTSKEWGKFDEDGDDLMEENNKLDLMESQMADCKDLE